MFNSKFKLTFFHLCGTLLFSLLILWFLNFVSYASQVCIFENFIMGSHVIASSKWLFAYNMFKTWFAFSFPTFIIIQKLLLFQMWIGHCKYFDIQYITMQLPHNPPFKASNDIYINNFIHCSITMQIIQTFWI